VWTPTPSTPQYCPSGQQEAVYSVARSGDDGEASRSGPNYNNLANPAQSTAGYRRYEDFVLRRYTGGTYKVQVVNWRWNTATKPDGSAWPSGTHVTGAFVRPYWAGPGSGPRAIVLDWHAWQPPAQLSDADWTRDSLNAGDPTFAATTTRQPKGRQTLALENAAANVNLAGYTGLRLTATDTTPPAPNEDNTVAFRPQDFVTNAGDQSAHLVVCYIQGTPQPPSAPVLY
jgi:hypothetical protein